MEAKIFCIFMTVLKLRFNFVFQQCQLIEQKLVDSQLFFEFEKIPKQKSSPDFSTALHPDNACRNRYVCTINFWMKSFAVMFIFNTDCSFSITFKLNTTNYTSSSSNSRPHLNICVKSARECRPQWCVLVCQWHG